MTDKRSNFGQISQHPIVHLLNYIVLIAALLTFFWQVSDSFQKGRFWEILSLVPAAIAGGMFLQNIIRKTSRLDQPLPENDFGASPFSMKGRWNRADVTSWVRS